MILKNMYQVLKFAFFIIATMVLASLFSMPGKVYVEWKDYEILTSVNVLIIGVVGVALLLTFMFIGWQGLLAFFKTRHEKHELRQETLIHEKVMKALVLLELKNIEGALDLFNKAYKKRPQDMFVAYLGFKLVSLNSEDFPKVLICLEKHPLLKQLADKAEIEGALLKGNKEKADFLAQKALKSHQDLWFLKTAFGLALEDKRYGEALKLSHKIQDLYPWEDVGNDIARAWYEAAQGIEARHKDYESFLTRAYENDPGFAPAAVALALLYKKDLPKARRVLEESWKRRPSYEIGHAYCLLEKDSVAQAKVAQQLKAIIPHERRGYILGIFYYIKAKLWGEAKRELDAFKGENRGDIEFLKAIMMKEEGFDSEKSFEKLTKIASEAVFNENLYQNFTSNALRRLQQNEEQTQEVLALFQSLSHTSFVERIQRMWNAFWQ
jgi:uncharacterized membrane-anchored protein